MRKLLFCLFLLFSVGIHFLVYAKSSKMMVKPLEEQSFSEILKKYYFIADIQPKSAVRSISDELFWKYPLLVPKTIFSIDYTFGDNEGEIIATQGSDRAIQHMNRGRVLFYEKKYEEARKTWLSGRARFGKEYEFHRRNDYYIALSFLRLAKQMDDLFKGDLSKDELRLSFANAATFFNWAFIMKKDLSDAFLDQITPKALYTLAAIYYRFNRYNGAHGAADEGLNFLRRTGRKDYRHQLRRLIAETWIRNSSYLEALQELDTAIRQDPDKEQVALSLARVGDIYFDLNNYELAEEVYGISQAVAKEVGEYVPASLILRGESLFWLGEFSKAQQILETGVMLLKRASQSYLDTNRYIAWAELRIADAYLARFSQNQAPSYLTNNQNELLDKAKLAYYKVAHEFPNTEPAYIATIRRSCLELPFYQGKNIKHARETLENADKWQLSLQALELAWACKVASYTQRERTDDMVERVRAFAKHYPNSRFLASFVDPVKKVKAAKLDDYLNSNQYYLATLYYENYRNKLFKQLSDKRKKGLFHSYVAIGESSKAASFWSKIDDSSNSEIDLIRQAVFLSELLEEDRKNYKKNLTANQTFANSLIKKTWTLQASEEIIGYINRIQMSFAGGYHSEWLYHLISNWNNTVTDNQCNLLYTILSKWADNSLRRSKSDIWQAVEMVVDKNFPDLITKDKECSLAFLDLEAKLARSFPDKYAQNWLNRLKWPKLRPIVGHIWMVSEMLSDLGKLEEAHKLWVYLSENIPDSFPEKKLAKIRLDKSKTEFEDLWKH